MVDQPRTMDSSVPLSASAEELLQNVPAGVAVLDRARRVIYANPWLCEATGLSPQAIAGERFDDLLIEADQGNAAAALARVVQEGVPASWDAHLRRHQGERVIALSAKPLSDGQTIVAAQVSCLDTTAYQQALARAADCERALDRQQRETLALYSIGVGCTLTRDVDEVVRLIYLHAGKLFDCSTFAILLYDSTTREVSSALVVRRGQRALPRRWSLDRDQTLIGRALRDRQPLLIHDWAREVGENPSAEPHVIAPDTRSWLSVPLIGQDQLLGLICLQHAQRSAFDESDQRTLYRIADQATMVIENAQLYETVHAQLDEVSTLYMLSQQISSSLETHVVLDSVTNILKRVLVGSGIAKGYVAEDNALVECAWHA